MDVRQDRTGAAAGLSPDVIEQAVTLSAQGDTETAVALLLDGTETADTDVAPATSLGWSERDFGGLSESERASAMSENMATARAIRSLGRAATAAIEQAQVDGEAEKASLWIQRLDAAGQVLSGHKYNLLLNLEGEALVKMAAGVSN